MSRESTSPETPLIQLQMKDWQVTDQTDEHLTPLQKQPWDVAIARGPYDGIMIELRGPDGSSRAINVEIENGHVRLSTYGDVLNDPITHQILTPTGTLVMGSQASNIGTLFHEDGQEEKVVSVEAGCLGTVPTP